MLKNRGGQPEFVVKAMYRYKGKITKILLLKPFHSFFHFNRIFVNVQFNVKIMHKSGVRMNIFV